MRSQLQSRQIRHSKVLDDSFNIKPNTLKINTTNTFNHELAKFLLLWELRQSGNTLVCEAIFSNGKRADIYCLDDATAYEILHTETKERFEQKKKDYPCQIIGLTTKEIITKNLKKFLKSSEENE